MKWWHGIVIAIGLSALGALVAILTSPDVMTNEKTVVTFLMLTGSLVGLIVGLAFRMRMKDPKPGLLSVMVGAKKL